MLLDVLVDSSFRVGVLLGGLRLESGWYSYVGLGEGRIAWGLPTYHHNLDGNFPLSLLRNLDGNLPLSWLCNLVVNHNVLLLSLLRNLEGS